jgi:hypothetical protein
VAINFSTSVYLPCQDTFGRSITVVPLASRPGTGPYVSRGHYDTRPVDVMADEGTVVADHETVLYIREVEFEIVPEQTDQIFIPAYDTLPEAGFFEVTNAITNGAGETTLVLRKLMRPAPEQVAMPAIEAPRAPVRSRGGAPW